MAERIKNGTVRRAAPNARTFGTTAAASAVRLSWLWSRESVLRLGLSLVLAVALWLYVTGKENPTVLDYNQALPVGTANVGNGLTVTNALPPVHVRIRIDNVNQLITTTSFHTFVNLLGRRPGTYSAVPVQVVSDPGIHVVQVTPSTVPVIIEKQLDKNVPVVAHVLTPASAGYEMLQPRFDPNFIHVSGPSSLVSQVTEASVDLNLAGVKTSLEGPERPLLLDSQGVAVAGAGRVLLDPPEVNVHVPVRQLASFKTLPVLVPIRGLPRPGFGVNGVTAQPAEVTAKGPARILTRLSTASTGPVWVSNRSAGQVKASVPVRLPAGVTSSSGRVTVRVEIAPVEVSSSIQVGVEPQNVSPGLSAHTTPAYVLVTAVGPSSLVRRAARSIRATIDLAGYTAGTYVLSPRISAPGLTVHGIYPAQVTVSLQPAPTR